MRETRKPRTAVTVGTWNFASMPCVVPTLQMLGECMRGGRGPLVLAWASPGSPRRTRCVSFRGCLASSPLGRVSNPFTTSLDNTR